MADGIKIDISGDKAIMRKLGALPQKVEKKVITQAVRKAAKPILAQMKANAPVKSGAMKKGIKTKVLPRKQGMFRMIVGISKKWVVGKFYGAYEEFGHKTGSPKQKSKAPRKPIKGGHYAEEAYKSKGKGSLDIAKAEILSGIEREAK